MNRLSYGAAGLLLALSLTAIISSTSAISDEILNSDRAKLLIGGPLNSALSFTDEEKKDYIIRVGNYLVTHAVFGSEKKDCKDVKKENMQESCLNDDRIKNVLNKGFLNKKSKEQLVVYVKFFYTVAYGYLDNFQRLVKNESTENMYTEALDALKIDGHITADQHATHKEYHLQDTDAYPNLLKEDGYNGHVDKEEAYQNFHFKTHMTSREAWDKAYEALPQILKYGASGLYPIKKARLYNALKVAFSKEQDKTAYAIAKAASARHLQALAEDARNAALPSATNAAGLYLRDNPEYKEMLKHIHDHPTPETDMAMG